MTVSQQDLIKKSTFPVSAQLLYNYHAQDGALARLIPPWDKVTILNRHGGLGEGGKTDLKLHLGPFSTTFEAHHLKAIEGVMFEDSQHKGPFQSWHHSHYFENSSKGGVLTDHVRYQLPFHQFLPSCIKNYVRHSLERTFNYRHKILEHDLKRHTQYSTRPLSILISGASGVLGRELIPFLTVGGHKVWTLVRRKPEPNSHEIFWNPAEGIIDIGAIPKIDAVIHLAGEYIGLGRWSDDKKREVIESRKRGTHLLSRTIADLQEPPAVFLSSSAIGYYGDCNTTVVDEKQPPGNGFMAEVCDAWEKATQPAIDAGIRTVQLRMGVALSARGGALQKLLQIAPIGFPKSFGNGKQYTSWISIEDMLAAMLHCICTDNVSGPINITAPTPVTNEELLYTLAKLKKKPIFPRVPVSYLTFFYGEMAKEIALSSCRVSAEKLINSGFVFEHNTLLEAIKPQLGIFDR